MSTANTDPNQSLSDLNNRHRARVRSRRDEAICNAVELQRMRDILSMGLADAHDVSVSLISAGVTPEILFR